MSTDVTTVPAASLTFSIPSNLDGGAFSRGHQAFLCAFPTQAQLTEMLLKRLSINLEWIVQDGTLNDQVFDLMLVAKREGWLDIIFQAAHLENPTCPELLMFLRNYATT